MALNCFPTPHFFLAPPAAQPPSSMLESQSNIPWPTMKKARESVARQNWENKCLSLLQGVIHANTELITLPYASINVNLPDSMRLQTETTHFNRQRGSSHQSKVDYSAPRVLTQARRFRRHPISDPQNFSGNRIATHFQRIMLRDGVSI